MFNLDSYYPLPDSMYSCAFVSMIMVSSMTQTTETLKLCSANGFLAQTSWPRRGIVRLIGLGSMHLIMLMRLEPREV